LSWPSRRACSSPCPSHPLRRASQLGQRCYGRIFGALALIALFTGLLLFILVWLATATAMPYGFIVLGALFLLLTEPLHVACLTLLYVDARFRTGPMPYFFR
jgi:hypothetical protein